MKDRIKFFLSQPSPFLLKPGEWFIYISALSVLAFLFTYIFEPFNVYFLEHKFNYGVICLLHALIASILAYLYFVRLDVLKINTLGSTILRILLFFLLVGTCNFLIRDIIYDNPLNWSYRYFREEIFHAFMIGIFFLWMLVPIKFLRPKIIRFYDFFVVGVGKKKQGQIPPPDKVQVRTQVKADDFQLSISHFVFARSEGNYTEIFTIEKDVIKKQLKRIPLKSLEQQMSSYACIIKTHRAYLVNKHMVEKFSGNAQGYRLTLHKYPEKVPVSRAFVPALKNSKILF